MAGAEKLMSMRIAVALAATIGAGILMSGTAEARPDVVGFRGDYSPGTIVIIDERAPALSGGRPGRRRALSRRRRQGRQAMGRGDPHRGQVSPPGLVAADVKRDKPSMPDMIPGGSPHNPMGVAAMTLAGGEYAIHGTNVPGSVGGFVSYGCIRMLNPDITDLYQRVSVGTPVVVTR